MPFQTPPPIETDRLIVRLVEEPDLPALMQVNGDDEVTRYLPYQTWRTLNDAQAWYRRMHGLQLAGQALQFVVVDKRSTLAVGTCLLFRLEDDSARAELGYVLARSYWGTGCMHDALHALIGAAFDSLSLRRLEAEVDPRNSASHKLLLKLGFTHEGLLRQRWLTKGVPADTNIYGLLRSEWQQRFGAKG
jgi:ribosomal-protein-alanine N-acetyltransferase